MSKIDKSHWLRDEAMYDRAVEATHRIAPGHMTMRAVTELEHQRVRDSYDRLITVWAMLAFSAIITEPGWLDEVAGWSAVGGTAAYVAWFFIDRHRTRKRVLTVLENHAYLQDEAAAARY